MSKEYLQPERIEQRSMEIIAAELEHAPLRELSEAELLILKRVIHTSADFDYAENLVFSDGAVDSALAAMRQGAHLVTDTQMALAGINKPAAQQLQLQLHCFISDVEVARAAREQGTTRAVASMNKLTELTGPLIVVVGNAPTALIQLHRLIRSGDLAPELIVAVPVGFVNVVESKELILQSPVPHIVARGRKGGSNIAASIVNALMYQLVQR